MSLLFLPRGIKNLSELDIDIDKDWNAREISDIESMVDAMAHGDIFYHSGALLTRLPAGALGLNLQCQGPGRNPKWS